MPQVVAEARQTRGVTLDRDHRRTRGGKLGRLAAGSRAEIGDTLARTRREQPGRQSSRGVLHPEIAALEAGHSVTRVPAGKRKRASGQPKTVRFQALPA